ncbi:MULTISPECIES: DUF3301 domain-containing protein [unclassified Pseudomonas]|uniref:DUF3301 domain-containing protein n=1 Tax=unclassified Pseudomonas TaxID=196821 RepID=UPI0024497CBB|nr:MULTISPECIES: DUF3301 domain-containing protein [unclassified Pseudomonas]MDG9923366.1 DUF3301 domain-containing protein [Pseudomonas sp. GD04045]MDH0035510.1 DUF3301 domain-containing protein [Pseudomonas sp. GD04019]
MIDLLDVLLLMLFATACAWLWRGHGIRERALALAKQHCAKLDIELLDGNVAFRRLALVRDARGQRRVARIYDFEFTVTGEQRLTGSISMYGRQFGGIELQAHPFQAPPPLDDKVIQLDDWRRSHPRPDDQRRVD